MWGPGGGGPGVCPPRLRRAARAARSTPLGVLTGAGAARTVDGHEQRLYRSDPGRRHASPHRLGLVGGPGHMIALEERPDGVLLPVKAQAGARSNAIRG